MENPIESEKKKEKIFEIEKKISSKKKKNLSKSG
jgi:hypothetical protein